MINTLNKLTSFVLYGRQPCDLLSCHEQRFLKLSNLMILLVATYSVLIMDIFYPLLSQYDYDIKALIGEMDAPSLTQNVFHIINFLIITAATFITSDFRKLNRLSRGKSIFKYYARTVILIVICSAFTHGIYQLACYATSN